jgi:hypothetical protein
MCEYTVIPLGRYKSRSNPAEDILTGQQIRHLERELVPKRDFINSTSKNSVLEWRKNVPGIVLHVIRSMEFSVDSQL